MDIECSLFNVNLDNRYPSSAQLFSLYPDHLLKMSKSYICYFDRECTVPSESIPTP
jgi:hypothetical protein